MYKDCSKNNIAFVCLVVQGKKHEGFNYIVTQHAMAGEL